MARGRAAQARECLKNGEAIQSVHASGQADAPIWGKTTAKSYPELAEAPTAPITPETNSPVNGLGFRVDFDNFSTKSPAKREVAPLLRAPG